MAEASTAEEEQLLRGRRQHVQELVENGDELPQGYLWKDTCGYGPIDLAVPIAADIPVIDFGRLSSSPPSDMDAELVKLRSALAEWGCFQTVNHGIDISFLENLRELSREFFHLPMAEKQKYARSENDHEGYGYDLILYKHQSLDWTDRLYLTVSPQDQRRLEYWPKTPNSFRDVLTDYIDRVRKIQEGLLKAMARSLSLPEDRFLRQFGEQPKIWARFNYYPPCTSPDLVLGLKPHSDGSGITILLQDKDLQGLQLLKDDKWFQVPIMPHALLVNVGDQLEIMSNGALKSPVHRALTNSQWERNTLAMFCCPDSAAELEPLEELVDGMRPRQFKKVNDYLGTYFHYFQRGKRPLDAVRL